MAEAGFRVKKDTDFYKNYFQAKEEKKKWRKLAKSFFIDCGLEDRNRNFYLTTYLAVNLNSEERKIFENQLRTTTDKNGLWRFKAKSKMQKDWNKKVVSKVNLELIVDIELWFWNFATVGNYALWDYKGEIYGYLMDKYKDKIELADYMAQIKLSEYYTIIEEIEENDDEKTDG